MNWVEGQLLHAGKYRIKRQVGGGGFGLTYLAEELLTIKRQIDINVGLTYMAEELPIRTPLREVVIKTPNRTLQDDLEYEKFIKRFQLEGQRLAKISHPNVVGVLEFFQEAGVPCLVMEYAAGETLSALVKRQGCLSEDEALLCFEKLAEALQAVHSEGLIHCDVHPKNIILQR
ncbi:MAG TPA: protein kinase, partial [Thermosynechococcaceae cyanobacterium]